MTRWDPDELLAAAAAATGLDDFGPDGFRPGLEAYCASLGSEAMLSEIGELAVRSTLDANLAQRLRVLDWHRRHPHVASRRLARQGAAPERTRSPHAVRPFALVSAGRCRFFLMMLRSRPRAEGLRP